MLSHNLLTTCRIKMASSTENIPREYPKRPGTSGIRGQLYETKLLSLIYFRAIHDARIEEFHLATNVDKIGSFDDICFRAKVRGIDKPLTVFIQAKHRENNNSVFTLNKNDLAEYFNSYSEIRRKFKPNHTDVLFDGTFSETECLFVLYTTAKGDKNTRAYKGCFADHLNALIGTGDPGSWPSLDLNHEKLCKLVLEEQITALARTMAKCICGEFNDIQMLMQDELVLQYHVILGQKVFDVSEKKSEGHRVARFRDDFFDINEELFLQLFKDELCTDILKRLNRRNPLTSSRLLNSLILLREITDKEKLYKIFGRHIIYKNGKFVFLDKNIPESVKLILDKNNESQETTRRTVKLAVKNCLPSQESENFLEFKVPASFGNKDLTIKGGDNRIERKLKDLTSKIVEFIEKSKPSNIVIIDKSQGESFLQLSGGIASAVGNLLIFDESSKLIKFNDNYKSLGDLAKKLYDKLKTKIDNMNEYRFDVKAKIFPKLFLATDEYNNKNVREFLSTLLFYTSQNNEKDVEETLIYEINNCQGDDVKNVEVTSDAIFLKYHDEIQKWSMTSEVGMGSYLEKDGNLYKTAVKHTTSQPLISVINMMQRIKNKNYTFSEDAVNSIKFDDLPSGTVIVTENSALTIAKLMKHLNNKDTVVLDFEYIINLSPRDDSALRRELMTTKEVKTLIVIFNYTQIVITCGNSEPYRNLKNIANAMKDKDVIIITDENSVQNAKRYFSPTGNVIKDEIKLIDMSEESQKRILENTKVIFQGNEVSLGQILINDTIGYVEGDVLNKMMHSHKNIIGKPVSNSNYKPKLYIQRSIRQLFRNTEKQSLIQPPEIQDNVDRTEIKTLDAPEDDVFIIFGDPGMGKSTLLTHLSNWTDMGWIVRINLLEHTTQFSEWKDKKIEINTMESLKFLCQVALSEENNKTNDLNITLVQSADGTVCLTGCKGDEWAVFELKIFLNFYNSNQLIILLDGFDEIYPVYANEVLKLIKAVKTFPRTHKMWITSRSYDKMHAIFENLKFGTLLQIEPLDVTEQDLYLTRFWDEKEILKNLNDDQYKNIADCIRYVSESRHVRFMLSNKTNLPIELKKDMPFSLVGLSLVKYLKMNLSSAPPFVMSVLNEVYDACYMKSNQIFQNEFVATPLHLNIMADYLYHKIKEINIKPNGQWDWDYNIFNIYEYYLETKLKRIRFQEKDQNDMSKPDNILAYEREYADSILKHKKLAAYSLYYRSRSKLFDDGELKQIMKMINELKEGAERTGIICNVVDDIPIFVHSTFEEYLAVDYIFDLLKSKENQKHIWDFVLNVVFFGNMNVLAILDAKMKIDHDLLPLFKKHKKIIFELLLKQGKNTKQGEIKSSISEAIRYNLRNLAQFFIFPTLKGNLDESNLMDFIEIVKETNILLLAVKMEYEDMIANIVNHVKRIDMSKLSELFENIKLNENVSELSIDELINKLHSYVWTGMDIVPERKKNKELSNQIYFI